MHKLGIEPSSTELFISYFAIKLHVLKMSGAVTVYSGLPDSNRRPFDNKKLLQSNALPTELNPEMPHNNI